MQGNERGFPTLVCSPWVNAVSQQWNLPKIAFEGALYSCCLVAPLGASRMTCAKVGYSLPASQANTLAVSTFIFFGYLGHCNFIKPTRPAQNFRSNDCRYTFSHCCRPPFPAIYLRNLHCTNGYIYSNSSKPKSSTFSVAQFSLMARAIFTGVPSGICASTSNLISTCAPSTCMR